MANCEESVEGELDNAIVRLLSLLQSLAVCVPEGSGRGRVKVRGIRDTKLRREDKRREKIREI